MDEFEGIGKPLIGQQGLGPHASFSVSTATISFEEEEGHELNGFGEDIDILWPHANLWI